VHQGHSDFDLPTMLPQAEELLRDMIRHLISIETAL